MVQKCRLPFAILKLQDRQVLHIPLPKKKIDASFNGTYVYCLQLLVFITAVEYSSTGTKSVNLFPLAMQGGNAKYRQFIEALGSAQSLSEYPVVTPNTCQ